MKITGEATNADTRTCSCHEDGRPPICQKEHAHMHCWNSFLHKEVDRLNAALATQPDRVAENARLTAEVARLREALEVIVLQWEGKSSAYKSRFFVCLHIARKALGIPGGYDKASVEIKNRRAAIAARAALEATDDTN